MHTPVFSITSYDASILWRFFDGVSSAVASRMLRGSPPGEENLTFLLCELLDESTTALHALDYPLSKAKEDLEKSDIGITLDVGFQTHEHSKYVESKYSGADLGIVLSMDHPVLGEYRKAVLVQAKKLFAHAPAKEFDLYSEYASYNSDQARFLDELQRRFRAWDSVFYLWYNPPSTGFSITERKLIKAFEASQSPLLYLWSRLDPFWDEIFGAGVPFFGNRPTAGIPEDQEEEKAREWRSTQPAVKISNLDRVLAVTKNHVRPRIETLYESSLDQPGWLSFAPFADFFLFALVSSRCGNSGDQWIQLAEGQKIPMPPVNRGDEGQASSRLDELESPPIPRHTLTLTLRSTLPNLG